MTEYRRSKWTRRTAAFAVPVVAALTGGHAASQSVQPGLWETKFTIEIPATEAAKRRYETQRKQLASLPAEQRKEVEAAFPKPGVPLTRSERFCVTPEEAREEMKFTGVEEDEDCRSEYGERKGGRIPFRMTCKEPPSTGTGEVVVAGSKSYTTTVRMTVRWPGESPTESLMRTENRWLGADCGSVKPGKD